MFPPSSTSTSGIVFTIFSFSILVTTGLEELRTNNLENVEPRVPPTLNITVLYQNNEAIEAGSTPSLICTLNFPGRIWWIVKGQNFTNAGPENTNEPNERYDIKKATRNDTGNYTCAARTHEGEYLNKSIHIRVIEPGIIIPETNVRANATYPANLICHVHGHVLEDFNWNKINNTEIDQILNDTSEIISINETYRIMRLNFTSVARKDNGTYICRARDYNGIVKTEVNLFVIDKPQVTIDFITAVGTGNIFINWTINNGNEPIQNYYVRTTETGSNSSLFYPERIGVDNTSYILKGFKNNTEYIISLSANNSHGESQPSIRTVKTLDEDPIFVPKVSGNGVTSNSITIGWDAPSEKLKKYVHYYQLEMDDANGVTVEATIVFDQGFYVYAFEKLDPATTYKFKIAACSDYTKHCGNWSAIVSATTMDGIADPPENLSINCLFNNISSTSFISISWDSPSKPRGQIQWYNIQVTGSAKFKNCLGRETNETWGPLNLNVANKFVARFDNVLPNTQYTVRIYGVTRPHTLGESAFGNCTTPVTIPVGKDLNTRKWIKMTNQGRPLFKLHLPRITERNGPICCYRIFLVKLPSQKTIADLPSPQEIGVYSYNDVHDSPSGGAYIAEAFDSDRFYSEIFLGDGDVLNNTLSTCNRCFGLKPQPVSIVTPASVPTAADIGTTINTTTSSPLVVGTGTTLIKIIPETPTTTSDVPTLSINSPEIESNSTVKTPPTGEVKEFEEKSRRRREHPVASKMLLDEAVYDSALYHPQDGFLDENSNYTGFIEVIVFGNEENQYLTAYSSYFNILYGGPELHSVAIQQVPTLEMVLQISIALVLIITILLFAFCILHRYTKRAPQSEEIITLGSSFRHLCRSLRGRHQLVAASPPDMTPIAKKDLLQSYLERHRDSDYGFQHEFELLPDKFTDRTTRASEARENLYKNRYPDIKSYDQTRVRLSQMDGICGSDYINANFVLGYKERKKFICAQGPMENTVCDYWRMIWEQHLEMILMLTNLEEYSKTKCAKYWPDKGETKDFGDITVEHVQERAYSDYVVRELKMIRTGEREARTIVQYHFLVWKDFVAPEHPHAILRFIKRVNEAYSLEKGPILVHCSAGVGRTGTLVALDSLLQQLNEEGQVSIFNTVCDLRHQRNFLVQSLKQYIFIYRALMEMAQYGDTEITVSQLKGTVERSRQRDNGKEKCRMEEEYDKINSVLEDRKSFSVGGGDENRSKNRNELIIPYDRNRVILTPVPGKEHSTYINASFIEGYDNSESFIITQDPLESTIQDFWRMILEQCIPSIVMLSDLNEGPRKCPRYWPDDEIQYDHIRVCYIQSESCPYYTRREFNVSNTKTDENLVVTQYQYHGWPTVEGEVPEVTRGLIELVDQTVASDTESSGSLVVHCNYGSDRSSMFVALSILVQQLRTEKRVDIFTTTKKLRSQRHGLISSFAQYEFLHRAIVNYSDLHNLTDDDTAS